MDKSHRNKRLSLRKWLFISVLIISISVPISIWAAGYFAKVSEVDGLLLYQDGVKIYLPGEQQKSAKVQSIDPASGIPSKELQYLTPDDIQENISLDLKHDNNDAVLSYSVVKRDNRIIPIYKPGAGTLGEENNPLVPVGISNKYILQYGISLYIIDFEKKEILKFLPDESDSISIKSVQSAINDESYYYWATDPQVSPDGQFMIYQSNRRVFEQDIRIYNFATGEDRLLASGHVHGNQVVWNGNESVIIQDMDMINELRLSGTNEVKPIYELAIGRVWCGFYPNFLIQTGKYQMTWYNAETSVAKQIDILLKDRIEVCLLASTNTEYPSAIIWQSTMINSSLFLFRLDTGEIENLLSFDKPFEMKIFQWIDSDNLLLTGVINGSEKTYIVDVSEVIK